MLPENEPQTPTNYHDLRAVLLLGVLIAIIFLAVASIPFFWFDRFAGTAALHDPSDWGVYGDFVGGLVTPFVSLIALLLLIVIFRTQKAELQATRNALEESHQAQLHQAQIARYAAIIYAEAAKIQSIASQRSHLLEGHQQGIEGYQVLGALQDELSRLEQLENISLANLTGLTIDLGHVRDPEESPVKTPE